MISAMNGGKRVKLLIQITSSQLWSMEVVVLCCEKHLHFRKQMASFDTAKQKHTFMFRLILMVLRVKTEQQMDKVLYIWTDLLPSLFNQ